MSSVSSETIAGKNTYGHVNTPTPLEKDPVKTLEEITAVQRDTHFSWRLINQGAPESAVSNCGNEFSLAQQ